MEVPEEELRRKEEVRKRMSEKLKETLSRRQEMKRKVYELELKSFQELKVKFQDHDNFAHEEVVELFGEHHSL